MRFIGSIYAVEKLERLLELLLDDHGLEIGHDGSQQFDAFGEKNLRSQTYTHGLKIGTIWFNFYYDKRTGADRYIGAGQLTVSNRGIEKLIVQLEERRRDKNAANEKDKERLVNGNSTEEGAETCP